MSEKNYKKSTDIFKDSLNKNKNAFKSGSFYSNNSIIWTYAKDSIVIYRLTNGKVKKTERYSNIQWLDKSYDMKFEIIDKCVEIEGDFISFSIITEFDSIIHKNIPYNIYCFLKKNNKKQFYKKISNDMIEYKLFFDYDSTNTSYR